MASPLPDPVPLPEIHRVLVTKLRHHGDVLLTSPVFTTLARAMPGAEIDALVYRGTEPMLAGHPAIAQMHTIDRDWKRQGVATQVGAEWRLLRRLRARRFDLLIHLTEHSRGLQLARLLRPRWSVTQERRSHGALWRRHFTHFYRQPEAARRHTVEANLDALRRIGIYPDADDKRLVLRPDAPAASRATALLAQHRLTARGFIHVHPGSRWLFKCWPAGTHRGAARPHRRGRLRRRVDRRGRRARACADRRDPGGHRARHAGANRRPDRATDADRARGRHRAGARVRRRGLGADAHRGGDGHARRRACSALPGKCSGDPGTSPRA